MTRVVTFGLRGIPGRALWCGLVLVVAGVFTPAATARADAAPMCAPQVKDQIADITEHLRNWADTGIDGHVWALTEDDVRVRVWQIGTNHFCVRRDIHGTFRSFAAVSPNLTATVSAGTTGTEDGTDWAVITGAWAPQVPLSGFVGDFDLGCNQAGECAIHRGPDTSSSPTAFRLSSLGGSPWCTTAERTGSGRSPATIASATSRADVTIDCGRRVDRPSFHISSPDLWASRPRS
jgi:hypothetical protein